MQKGANAFPPKQAVAAAAESSEEDDSSEEEVSILFSGLAFLLSLLACDKLAILLSAQAW